MKNLSLFLMFSFVAIFTIQANTSNQNIEKQVLKKANCAELAANITSAYQDAGYSWKESTAEGDRALHKCHDHNSDTSVYIHN